MAPWTLHEIDLALRASWSADTCSPDDAARESWHHGSPSWGHCDITALFVHDRRREYEALRARLAALLGPLPAAK
ncbi:hypothetical protein LHJ74_22970 [Streptomyces sp. N2-109]|uniref:Uncharacterized protein n=1 Tax=Streptomyces gossypii TaxID=2883101 RepID=A0ABT2JXW0_9ACTN|nr:hypothetical protein [Streptomyces gossypii]MCT2592739.1 hypothetical protein [Streptomyces gossypii]